MLQPVKSIPKLNSGCRNEVGFLYQTSFSEDTFRESSFSFSFLFKKL